MWEDTAGSTNIHQSLRTSALSERDTLVSPAGRRDPLCHTVTAAQRSAARAFAPFWMLCIAEDLERLCSSPGGTGSCSVAACKPWGRMV